jgi:hypothetical protein
LDPLEVIIRLKWEDEKHGKSPYKWEDKSAIFKGGFPGLFQV